MGTNYYTTAEPCANACDHCEQQVEYHIGKSLTMFEAHEVSPWGRIESWQDWKRVIRQVGKVTSEYREDIPAEDFIARVEATDKADRRRQYDAIMGNPVWRQSSRDFLDADGFSFTYGDFS